MQKTNRYNNSYKHGKVQVIAQLMVGQEYICNGVQVTEELLCDIV